MINQILHANIRLVKDMLTQKKPHLKTGISNHERKRILRKENLENGTALLFGKPFRFTSATGFLHSLDEIFLSEIYRFTSDTDSPYIIDCGANMGLSVMFFKKMFPNARIDAFEADANICRVLKENMDIYFGSKDITVYDKAVWTEETTLNFYSDGGLSGSMMLDFAGGANPGTTETVDLKKFLTKKVDFLKIDIEGAENTVFFDIKDHLHLVKKLFLEYHGMIGDEQNLDRILADIRKCGYRYYLRMAGETIRYPFCGEKPARFDQQLNILCYRP